MYISDSDISFKEADNRRHKTAAFQKPMLLHSTFLLFLLRKSKTCIDTSVFTFRTKLMLPPLVGSRERYKNCMSSW